MNDEFVDHDSMDWEEEDVGENELREVVSSDDEDKGRADEIEADLLMLAYRCSLGKMPWDSFKPKVASLSASGRAFYDMSRFTRLAIVLSAFAKLGTPGEFNSDDVPAGLDIFYKDWRDSGSRIRFTEHYCGLLLHAALLKFHDGTVPTLVDPRVAADTLEEGMEMIQPLCEQSSMHLYHSLEALLCEVRKQTNTGDCNDVLKAYLKKHKLSKVIKNFMAWGTSEIARCIEYHRRMEKKRAAPAIEAVSVPSAVHLVAEAPKRQKRAPVRETVLPKSRSISPVRDRGVSTPPIREVGEALIDNGGVAFSPDDGQLSNDNEAWPFHQNRSPSRERSRSPARGRSSAPNTPQRDEGQSFFAESRGASPQAEDDSMKEGSSAHKRSAWEIMPREESHSPSPARKKTSTSTPPPEEKESEQMDEIEPEEVVHSPAREHRVNSKNSNASSRSGASHARRATPASSVSPTRRGKDKLHPIPEQAIDSSVVRSAREHRVNSKDSNASNWSGAAQARRTTPQSSVSRSPVRSGKDKLHPIPEQAEISARMPLRSQDKQHVDSDGGGSRRGGASQSIPRGIGTRSKDNRSKSPSAKPVSQASTQSRSLRPRGTTEPYRVGDAVRVVKGTAHLKDKFERIGHISAVHLDGTYHIEYDEGEVLPYERREHLLRIEDADLLDNNDSASTVNQDDLQDDLDVPEDSNTSSWRESESQSHHSGNKKVGGEGMAQEEEQAEEESHTSQETPGKSTSTAADLGEKNARTATRMELANLLSEQEDHENENENESDHEEREGEAGAEHAEMDIVEEAMHDEAERQQKVGSSSSTSAVEDKVDNSDSVEQEPEFVCSVCHREFKAVQGLLSHTRSSKSCGVQKAQQSRGHDNEETQAQLPLTQAPYTQAFSADDSQ